MQNLPEAFAPLAAFNQWMCYQVTPSKKRANKFDKFPVSVETAQIVDAHNPTHWVDYQTAITTAEAFGDGYGVAFVFTENDPFFFVDIDGAYDGAQWSSVATQLCETFAGAAVEVSQSGTGLHIIGQYTGAQPEHSCKNIPLGLELYTSGRFIALTGTGITGTATAICDEPLRVTIDGYFPVKADLMHAVDWTTGPVEGHRPIADDDKLIEAMCASESSANRLGKASARDLWEGNVEALAGTYPDDVRDYDASSADGALAQHLSFWTCGDCERIEHLMRQSALYRDKWDYHKKYMSMTIRGAVSRTKQFYSKGADLITPPPSETSAPSLVMREGFQLMSPDQQREYFKGCVYVCELHRMFTPTGSMLKTEQFNAMYGGYAFALDSDLEKTTKKAFEAFTESQCLTFPKADKFCFRPQLDSGAIVVEEGLRLVNTYVPVDIEINQGDVTPFLQHLHKLLPVERDRTILLSYMAACVQNKGYKIQWAPLIQGVEGNGKTLFTRCVAYAMGKRYTHFPKASDLDNKFNAWLMGKLFYGVEDIYVPESKREVLEILKPMITGGDGLEIQMKGVDQMTADVCGNFIFNSNHKDAVRKTQNDRRFCVFYTAQQESIDITRDGMGGDYFPDLYDWLNGGGYAAVAGYLTRFAIPDELNPTTKCQRAPETSSTREAVSMSMGAAEQEIVEAIENGRQGFAGGWVSSFALDELLKEMRKDRQVPQNRRRQLMQSLGYDWHPHLKEGRVNNAIAIDNGKPRLFIRTDHIHNNLTQPSKIACYYAAAQGDPLAIKSVDDAVNS